MDITVTTCGVRTQGQPKETIVVMTGDVAVFRAMPQLKYVTCGAVVQ